MTANFNIEGKKNLLIQNGILAGIQLLTFIFWFMNVVKVSFGAFESPINIPDYLEANDFGFLSVFYIIFSIAGIVCLLASTFVENKFFKKLMFIPTGLAMAIQIFGLITAFLDAKATVKDSGGLVEGGFTFGGILTLLAIIALVVLDSVFRSKQKKAEKAA